MSKFKHTAFNSRSSFFKNDLNKCNNNYITFKPYAIGPGLLDKLDEIFENNNESDSDYKSDAVSSFNSTLAININKNNKIQ